MIIHSYQTDFAWTRDINIGIKRILVGKPYLRRFYYLDTKRNPDSEYKKRAGRVAVGEVEKWKPDILILIDDNAQTMVGKAFINHPTINIIFTGVNADPAIYGYDKSTNVTGVLERIPFKSVQESLMMINPQSRFIHICDSSETSTYIQAELESFRWDPLKLVETKLCFTFDDWKKSVFMANKDADFLLITHYHTIKGKDNRVMNPVDVIQWTRENTQVPLIGCWDFFVEDGGMMSISVSPYEQGEIAAKMALEIIEKKKKPHDMPFYRNKQFTVSMRGNDLKKHNIKLPLIFESFARAVNHYYE